MISDWILDILAETRFGHPNSRSHEAVASIVKVCVPTQPDTVREPVFDRLLLCNRFGFGLQVKHRYDSI